MKLEPSATPWPDVASLSRDWAAQLGETPPLGNALRAFEPTRWVRLHYLPEGRRIARTKAERAEVLRRFQTVLSALGADDEGHLLVTTCGWGSSMPAARPPDLTALLPAAFWREVPADGTDDVPASVYATSVPADSGDPTLAEFLMVWVADALTAEAIIATPSLTWLLHPYDGGMDVIARDQTQRDALAATYADWLSPRSDGL